MADDPSAQDEPHEGDGSAGEDADAAAPEGEARDPDTESYPDPVVLDDDDGEVRGPRADGDPDGEVRGPRFATDRLPAQADDLGEEGLASAYESLQIRTPLEEFETYAEARLETLVRLGESERAALTSDAMKLGLDALRHVMGGAPREAS